MKKLKLLVAGGGTGGHLFPGMAIAQAFEQAYPTEVRFVGSKRGIESRVIPQKGYRLYCLSVQGLYRVGPLKKILALIKLPFAFLQALWILLSYRPHVVVGVGGYAAGPMLLVSLLLRKRVVLQEQNASPGMTNRILGKLAPLSFVPFAGLEGVFKNPVVVGNPIRREILEASKVVVERPTTPFVISIVGGSQGASVINRAMLGLLDALAKYPVQIYHQTGKMDLEAAQAAYQAHPEVKGEPLTFIEDMAGLYQKTHLVIARAGSMVNELTAMGKASILIPIPFSSGDHQRQNAIKMRDAGAAILLEQRDLTPESLLAAIVDLIEDQAKLAAMEKAAKALFPGDAAQRIQTETHRFFQLEKVLA